MKLSDALFMIRPSKTYPTYWEYQGQPVLLLGGSKEDNLFQIADLKDHLDLLASVGGNVIRNTMSDRDPGDLYAYARKANGQFELDQWNPDYWDRFEACLRLTSERGIIVQLEVWDRFDYSREPWKTHPFNPSNNDHLPTDTTGLESEYPQHPNTDRQPFFHTIPGMNGYRAPLDRLRAYQEAYVAKLLSIALAFDHVLYCINNETSTEPAWGAFWIRFIKERAALAGREVWVTDMFDDFHKGEDSRMIPVVTQHPEIYDFFDISQVNSRSFGFAHWEKLQFLITQARRYPRPANHTKIYSDGQTGFGSGTPQDGIERFWRNLMGGSASARFHRPPAGIGLNPLAQQCIRTARWVEKWIAFWEMEPAMDEIVPPAATNNQAYLTRTADLRYLLFLPYGEAVSLTLQERPGQQWWQLRWTNSWTGEESPAETLKIASPLRVTAPQPRASVAVLQPLG